VNFWDLYVLVIIVIYLTAFFIRNVKTYRSVKISIRGRSGKLTLSLAISMLIYLITLTNLLIPKLQNRAGKITILETPFLKYTGYTFIFIALVIGLMALYEMRNSWRVGIRHDQKTELVTSGIYALSRNPYFLSYDILFIGIFLIYPSLTLLVLITALMIVFHQMIKEEELYLENIQGDDYLAYKKKVGRYIFIF